MTSLLVVLVGRRRIDHVADQEAEPPEGESLRDALFREEGLERDRLDLPPGAAVLPPPAFLAAGLPRTDFFLAPARRLADAADPAAATRPACLVAFLLRRLLAARIE